MILFKEHRRKDIALRVKWLNNKKANFFAVDNPEKDTTEKEQTKWFDNYEKGKDKFFFTIFSNNFPIGFVGLSNMNNTKKEANLFLYIGEDEYRGKGIGREIMNKIIKYSFDKLKLNKIFLEVNVNNHIAIKLYELYNFKEIDRNDKEIKMVLEKT